MIAPKPLDVNAIIDAKRERLSKGSAALARAEQDSAQAAAESARRAATACPPKPRAGEQIHERVEREKIEKEERGRLLAQVQLVSYEEDSEPTAPRPRSSRRRRSLSASRGRSSRRSRARSSRRSPVRSSRSAQARSVHASRTARSRSAPTAGSGGGGSLVMAITAAVVAGGLLIALL